MIRKLKQLLIVVSVCIASFAGYILFVNRNSENMTLRQKFLKVIYPLYMAFGSRAKAFGKRSIAPQVSFYSLKAIANNGNEFDFAQLKGKKVLLVNTASDCGFTGQYDQLQLLQEKYKDHLVIIGFPANDFKEQEKGSDEEIAAFCKINFGVTFPLMKKSTVRKGAHQNNIFKWLSDSTLNGWSNKQPSWNFSKYLVDENGHLVHYFDPSISPLSNEVINEIKK